MKTLMRFTGFPKEGLLFLTKLRKNNNTKWFRDHYNDYQEYLIKPAQAFVEAFGYLLRKQMSKKIVYDTRINGSGSIFRINRDIRFSKDKTPYKTHLGILFWEDRQGKKLDSPGVYFHLEEQGAKIHVGHYEFNKAALERYRKAVSHKTKGAMLETITQELVGSGKYLIGGENYKMVPRGYDPNHSQAHLLKYNGLYASSPWISAALMTHAKLPEVCMAHCQHMVPLFNWLVKNKI